MRRFRVVLLVALAAAGCGSTSTSHHKASPPAVCPRVALGQGYMGACTPVTARRFGLMPPASLAGRPTYPDLSNNDSASCSQLRAIKRAGHPGLYEKTVQGTAFIDRTFAPMTFCARHLGLITGGYDFVSTYSVGEARLFVRLLREAGMTRTAARWFPPTLDVEYATATRGGVGAMANVLRRAFGRVNIYTGAWYWTPHLGCFWIGGATGWISGYPFAPSLCGLPRALYNQHQYTDRGFNGAFSSDMTVWTGSPSGFRAFAHLAPAPKPLTPTQRRRKLKTLVAWRAHLRRVLARYGCRHGRNRREIRPVNCLLTLRRGDHVNRQIKELIR